MTASMRYRQPWSSNEVNRLYSEYELRQLPILDIAKLHKRGEYAILHRLAKEGLILETWSDVRGWKTVDKPMATVKPTATVKPSCPFVNTVFFSENSDEDVESLEDNDDPNDGDYIYESDEDDENDFSDSEAEEQDNSNESDSDYEDEVESVESDSDYEDEADAKDEDYDPYSIKQKARFMHNIISALKFFVYAA